MTTPSNDQSTDTQNDVTLDEAEHRLIESRGSDSSELSDLTRFHEGATSYLVQSDMGLKDSEDGYPDDLDSDTKRQLSTAKTLLERATKGLSQTAQKRLNANSEDDEGGA